MLYRVKKELLLCSCHWNRMSLKHIMYQTVYLFFVHYGWEGSNDPRVIDVPTVVLTSYCILSASYKSHSENGIFQKVDWYRLVFDEAHTIKAMLFICVQTALSTYCRNGYLRKIQKFVFLCV